MTHQRGLPEVHPQGLSIRAGSIFEVKAGEIFVAGKWQAPQSGETYQPINPANEEPVGTVGKGDERDIDLAVTAARKAFDEGPWPKMTPHERGMPQVISMQRRRRIAAGSGTSLDEVNKLMAARKQMAKMMKQVGKGKMPTLPPGVGGPRR